MYVVDIAVCVLGRVEGEEVGRRTGMSVCVFMGRGGLVKVC